MQTNYSRWSRVGRASARLLILILATAAASGPVSAADSKADVKATIKQAMESRYPGTHVLDVQPAAMPGLYEVFVGDQIVYTDASADYLVMGPLIDTQTRQNLTDERMSERGKIDFHTLPLDKAIKVVKGNGSRVFAVFSDPDCPFCQQLEKSLLSVNDLTMYVFLFPIASLHPQSPAKAHAIWCAGDHVKAWNEWMQGRKLPPATKCKDDPVNDLQKLGDQLHIDSTPTLFLADGRRISGSMPPEQLEKLLASASGPKPAAAQPAPAAPSAPTPAASK